MNVLLIEDDPLVRDSIVKVLERGGFGVTAVPNGLQGLAELRDGRYAAIVCDLRLPFLQGDDFFTQVKDLFPDMVKRMVYVTGLVDDSKAREFLEGTGQPFLGKPFESSELIEMVSKVAGKV